MRSAASSCDHRGQRDLQLSTCRSERNIQFPQYSRSPENPQLPRDDSFARLVAVRICRVSGPPGVLAGWSCPGSTAAVLSDHPEQAASSCTFLAGNNAAIFKVLYGQDGGRAVLS